MNIEAHLLQNAVNEIRALRRSNEILSAKVEMIDLFACVLNTQAAQHAIGAVPDVAWMIEKAIHDNENPFA